VENERTNILTLRDHIHKASENAVYEKRHFTIRTLINYTLYYHSVIIPIGQVFLHVPSDSSTYGKHNSHLQLVFCDFSFTNSTKH